MRSCLEGPYPSCATSARWLLERSVDAPEDVLPEFPDAGRNGFTREEQRKPDVLFYVELSAHL